MTPWNRDPSKRLSLVLMQGNVRTPCNMRWSPFRQSGSRTWWIYLSDARLLGTNVSLSSSESQIDLFRGIRHITRWKIHRARGGRLWGNFLLSGKVCLNLHNTGVGARMDLELVQMNVNIKFPSRRTGRGDLYGLARGRCIQRSWAQSFRLKRSIYRLKQSFT